MREREYSEIALYLREALPNCDEVALAQWAARFPEVHVDTLINIAWQLFARSCKRAAAAQVGKHLFLIKIERNREKKLRLTH